MNRIHDPVRHPVHYQLNIDAPAEIELIDVRDALLAHFDGEPISARAIDYWSRSWEYLSRWIMKNGVEDLEKAKWYLDRLIKECDRIGYDPGKDSDVPLGE